MAITTFDGLNTAGLVPAPVVSAILTKVQEQSVVTRLAGTTPIPLEGASIAVQTGHIEAGVVGEGEAKSVGKTDYAVKTIKPIKVAAIAIVSKEVRLRNPVNVLQNIQDDLAGAVTRAFDLAILHGRNSKTGATIAGVEYLNQTANRVTLGTATAASGGIAKDLLTGYDLVVNGDQIGDDFTGFAADRRLRSKLMGSFDTSGRPIFQQSTDLRNGVDNVLGLPTAYGKSVSGRVGASTDTGVRAFGGDFESLKYGFAETMTISRSDQATVVDGATTYNLWQENLEAYLVEAIFGWVITDLDSFTAYEEAPSSPAVASSASPSAVAAAGTVTIHGSGFIGATQVKFGTSNATSFAVVDGDTITAVMPAGSAGSAAITVVNPAGTSNSLAYTRGA